MTESKPVKIREKPPQGPSLNKVLIIALCLFCAVILVWVLVSGLSPHQQKQKTAISPTADTEAAVAPAISKLPDNYDKAKQIRHYLSNRQNSHPNATLMNEITQLRQQQTMLKQQLTQLQQQRTAAPAIPHQNINTMMNSAHLTAAKKSTILFNTHNSQLHHLTPFASVGHTSGKPSENKTSDYEKQNMQNQKLAFLQSSAKDDNAIYDQHRLVKPVSPYEVQAGTIIPSLLLTAINSSLPGTAVAQIKQDVYDTVSGHFLLIPKGSRIIGHYDSKIAYGQTRILIVFTRIIMPNGNSIQLSRFSGSDLNGAAGLDANINNHWLRILSAASISTILSLGTGIAGGEFRYDNTLYPSYAQNALYGAANSISSTGQQLAGRAMNIQPTLTIAPGFQFNVIVNKDMILTPYRR